MDAGDRQRGAPLRARRAALLVGSSRNSGEYWPPMDFCSRLASTIGLEAVLGPVAGTRVRLPDGSDRFVVDLPMLLDWTERPGGHP